MPTENKLALKRQRVEHVNQAIRIIADHGRRFFYSQAVNRYASMEVDARGKVWFSSTTTAESASSRMKRCGVVGGAASVTAARCAA